MYRKLIKWYFGYLLQFLSPGSVSGSENRILILIIWLCPIPQLIHVNAGLFLDSSLAAASVVGSAAPASTVEVFPVEESTVEVSPVEESTVEESPAEESTLKEPVIEDSVQAVDSTQNQSTTGEKFF